MGDMIKALMGDTKRLGRIVALVVILGIAGGISINITSAVSGEADINTAKLILDQWIDLAKIAVMFYFMKTLDKDK